MKKEYEMPHDSQEMQSTSPSLLLTFVLNIIEIEETRDAHPPLFGLILPLSYVALVKY